MTQLEDGDPFPTLTGDSVNHGGITLPGDIPGGRFAVILAYRAQW